MTAFPWLPCLFGIVLFVSFVGFALLIGALAAARDITVDDGEW